MMVSTKSWIATLTGIVVALVRVNAKPVHHLDGVSNFNTIFPSPEPSTDWQKSHEVTKPLPNITFPLGAGRSFAGNIPLQRGTNLSLFYWAVESQQGSLTSSQNLDSPWILWLNGGPGTSSMFGFMFENGPIRINPDYSISQNNWAWSNQADVFWVDQPVGTGYSTLENDGSGQVVNEDDVGRDFIQFLTNLVKVYPNLAKRPLHLMGESYAGMYIPYITKHYFGTAVPPVNLAKIAMGDGTMGNSQVFNEIPTIYVLATFPEIIGYDAEVFQWFQQQNHLCGYDLNFTYPQNGKFPTVNMVLGQSATTGAMEQKTKRSFMAEVQERHKLRGPVNKRREERRAWKRNLSGRGNGTIDPWYGCDLFTAAIQYAANFTYPWNAGGLLNYYDVSSALNPGFEDGTVFMNDNQTRAAIHAPAQQWALTAYLNWSNNPQYYDTSAEPMVFFDELAANATSRQVGIVMYSGNNDALIPHRGTEAVIQNTTFGGIQGFSRKPSTPWTSDDGSFGGIVHQERGWTYALFKNAGHSVPTQKPVAAFTFLREFVLGNNQTGLVEGTSVVGGEDSALAVDVLTEGLDIYLGSYVTQSTYVYPSQTIANFRAFLATGMPTPMPSA